MDNMLKYLKDSLKFRDNTEFVEVDNFNQELFDNLKQDGFMLIHSSYEQIDSNIDHVHIGNYILIRKNSPRQIAWLDENGNFDFDESRNPIYRRIIPPPCETVNHTFLISCILDETNAIDKTYRTSFHGTKSYIEYGVRTGTSIEKIASYVNFAHGIDMVKYQAKSENIKMYKMTTDEFSKNILPSINYDYAFIDADHCSRQVVIDFEYIYKHLNPNGYIFLHDTYPCDASLLHKTRCNDCYKSPLIIKERYPNIEMLTLPMNPGLTIIRKI